MTHIILPRPSILDDCDYIKLSGDRKVWASKDRNRYYTWDSRHGEIEVFNKRGCHLGSINPISGTYIKPAVKGRRLDV